MCRIGWQDCGVFAVNSFLQLNRDGAVIPEADYEVWLDKGNFKQVPVPTVQKVDSKSVKPLYQALENEFSQPTYMTCVLMGGRLLITQDLKLFSSRTFCHVVRFQLSID